MDTKSDDLGDLLKYKIPDDIKARIPEYFYYALGGELVSVFGNDSILICDEDGFTGLDYSTSTNGYVIAFRATCNKLNMDWLYEYWDKLEWYHSDIFDGEIADEVLKCFHEHNGNGNANSYYLFLLKKFNPSA